MISELLRPWRRRQTWWDLTHLMLDGVLGTVAFPVLVVLVFCTLGSLIVPILWPFAAFGLWLTFVVGRLTGRVERSRFASLLDLPLEDPVPPLQGTNMWRRLLERFRVRARWREIGYGLLLLPLGLVTTGLVLVVWCSSIALVSLPLYISALPDDTARLGWVDISGRPAALLVAAIAAATLVVVAPWVTVGLAELDRWVGRRLLGPSQAEATRQQVQQADSRREAAVVSAEDERRRIERDLHDGAQQRLVALAMGLGTARERLESDPERGRELVAEAHEEAKAALKELRDLVRGIHPVILEDRGLDAAMSALVARSPVPVGLHVDVAVRPPAAVESTAYFVVSEALTNVARHAEAQVVQVSIVRAADRLVIEVRDDGQGGADASRGSGLVGLQRRVAAHGGSMHVISPEGGPTTLLVELPCGS